MYDGGAEIEIPIIKFPVTKGGERRHIIAETSFC